ncbi:component of the counting factor complex [Cavenderia fasciculata]|uniref:Component of the counting factor complex n=1 Tax=Cavenderia fasciculata TaxID=261658 RepID=F4Q4I3_CACFS|nr:component of the counting factor complex [Cavenderia fasciculata]EGG17832.1 component of the counting factor complex [Cavenderia fasciculata]|eukprot:XP_004356316.1 component of the counting factor complex [Cavenderia fasciculata]
MTWKLRHLCTCVYEKDTIKKWLDIGRDILQDEQEIERFYTMKNNCPTHFSHTRLYQPLTHDLKSSNQSKLQLILINKDIFNYISQNCFTVIKLECCEWDDTFEKHGNNAYCVALKHFTTITSDCRRHNIPKSLHNIGKDKLEQITKVVFYNGDCLQDLIKLLPNLTCIEFSKKKMGAFRELSLENLSKLKSLTKLDLSGIRLQRDVGLAEINNLPLKKLCLPSWGSSSLYNGLSNKLKRSITKIAATPYMDLSVFLNLKHILITSERDTSRWRLPQTVTKVSSKYLEIGFLPHNRQVTKFKTYDMFTDKQKNPSEDTDGMTLRMVQILTRHGDRTPLYNPLTIQMNDWNCSLSTYMYPSPNDQDASINSPSILFRKVYLPNREYWPGNCSNGQLTTLGWEQHQQVGTVFRQLYVEKYGLLSPDGLDLSEVWVRSTDVPRTLQSAQSEINALYPPNTNGGVNPIDVLDIHTMDDYYENMYSPNAQLCPILNSLGNNATNSKPYQIFVQQTAQLRQQIMSALKVKSFPGFYNFMDLFFATQCHDLPLPNGITEEIVNATYQAAFFEDSYPLSFPMISRLGMSTFLEELLDNIRNFINGDISYKYMLFSGHDDSVGPFVNLFNIYREWAPYASHVELELWQDDSSSEYYLQFKFNGQSYTLDGCPGVMCPIDDFFSIAYNILVPDYYDACNQGGSSSDSSSADF